ncbi:MAG: ABC transporter permease [Gemmatimonadaceae bacterium]
MSVVGDWVRRVAYLLRRRHHEEALRQEMEAHRDQMDDARRFGNTLRLREEARDTWGWAWLDHMVRDVRLAGRALWRTRGFTLTAVLSLALGFGLAAAAMAVTNAYLLRSLPYPESERLYHVRYAPPGPWEPAGMSSLDWASVSDVVEYPIASSSETYYLTNGGYAQPARGLRVDPGFLAGLGVRAVLGRSLAEQDYAPASDQVALIGHSLWANRFGRDSAIVGQLLRVELESEAGESLSLRIVGVLPPDFYYGRDSRATVDLLLPLQSRVRTYMVRLREGVPVGLAEHRITEAARAVGTSIPADWTGVQLESAHGRYVNELRPFLIAVTVAAALALMIVCANVAVLVLLRSARRLKEVAVRVALGAGRSHIVRMLAIESAIICGAAVAVGLALTAAALRALGPSIEERLGKPAPGGTAAISLDPTVLLIIGVAGLIIAFSLACVPLLTPWQRRLAETLRRDGRGGTDGGSMRRVRALLIAFEIGGSLALLVGCGLMIRSAVNLVRVDRGFESDRVVRSRIAFPGRAFPDAQSVLGFLDRMTERISARSQSPVAFTSWPPFVETPKHLVQTEGMESGGTSAGMVAVSAGYFATLGITLRQGRDFTVTDRVGTERVVVVSETLALRLWPAQGAIGRRLRTVNPLIPNARPSEWRTVVGVVGDVRQRFADEERGEVYTAYLQEPPDRFASFYFRSDRPALSWSEPLHTLIAELDSRVMVSEPLALASDDRELAETRFLTSLLTGFAIFAGFLATVGIYGVTAYAARQREREVAIRIALGATRREVVGMFLREGSVVLMIGVIIGVLAGAALARVLSNQIHGVGPFDLTTVLVSSAAMALASALATWWPARRAATANPLGALNEA